MTIEQRIQWVVLPAGLSPDGTQALVSVFVAPRLSVDGDGQGATLAPFEDFLDWPALLANARFMLDTATVDEGTGRSTAAGAPFGPLTLAGNPADSNLWKRFFHPDTPLDSFAFDDYAPRAKVTYAAADLARADRRAYADIASASPTELPDPAAMSGFAGFPSSEDMPDTLQNVAGKLDDADARAADDPTGNVQPDLSSAQEQFLSFHPQIRDGSTGAGELPEPPPRPDKPKPDFHQMLSALGDHPALLRRLGLVIDLALPVDQLPRTHGGLGLVLVPTVPSALPDSANVPDTPATLYVLDQDGNFCAAASGSDPLGPPARGLLALPVSESDDGVERPDTYRIEQTDTDGTNLKLLAASAAADAPPEGSPAPAAPPTVRTTGLALVHTGHAQALQSDLLHAADQNRQRDDDGLTTFTSEDLVRGYRVDVNDRGKWRSLNERIVSYNPPGAQAGTPPIVPPVTDEGFVQTGLMQPDGRDGRVHVHEHMVTWNGWALSAPLPGNVMVDGYDPNGGPGTPDPTAGPQPVRNEAFTKLPLEIETAPKPGSLPRLRFGAQYKLRVRTVDLAGNGPTVDQATDRMDQDDLALPVGGTTFRRHEPVPAPLLLPRSPFLEGTGAHRMVIRSDDGQSTAAYAAAFNASPLVAGGTHPAYLPVDERHLVAPKASLECVERHGKLDDAIASGNSTTRQAVYQLAVRESGSLDDPGLPGFRTAPDTPGHPGGYTLHTGESIQVPYLPDPLSLGVVFRCGCGSSRGPGRRFSTRPPAC
ncbi:MAG: hypothetical protein JF597_48320 [Streptomyces sp.]|uniref:hypothetical protein n=1 Tax=Streptomyces sp. TaxID=1931 RepID=UPI0025DA5AA4|nr:hypothetical protein [Streptomyces sp.]MBW8801082.1 hypothetical protein [Streptomyces sp.]